MKLKDVLLSKHIVEIAQNEILQATGTEGPTYSSIQPRVVKPEVVGKDPQVKLKRKILDQLVEELNLKKLDTETGNDPKKIALLRQRTKQAILAIMQRENIAIADRTAARLFVQDILDEALGLGALEKLLADPAVTEIMVNRKDQIYIEKNGKIQLVPLNFTSDEQLLGIIERIVAPLGRRIDEKTPYCDARLPDGSRVHAIIPPLSLTGPVLTIRKFSKTPFSIQDLIRFGSLTDEIADFLRAATESRQNIVVSGGTGTGKTTLLNVLSSFIPASDRIITVEDSAELRLTQPHVCRLESRPPNIEGKGAITIRDLVRNTLRMRPDRIVVGECRDGAALDMLQAMNTGHDGSLTTVHANNPRDCLSRLETLVMMAGMDLPSRAIREQIASAVNLIVQIARFSDGSRRITHISEVMGIEGDHIQIKDIVVFKQKGIDAQGRVYGDFIKTEHLPHFVMEIEQKGLRLPQGWTVKRRKSDFGEEE
ncbi:MAG: CpaF family protein [Deltaproteobacteria bacterium]|nr:CpaF family protein [Deltaproteobacteria bacterium]